MSLDRPVDSKTREALEKWVGDFLWHLEGIYSGNGSENLPDVPENVIIVGTILEAIEGLQDDRNKKPNQPPEPSSFFQPRKKEKKG